MEDSPINIAYPAAENLRLRIAMGACRFEARAGEGEAWVAGVCHDPTERRSPRILEEGASVTITEAEPSFERKHYPYSDRHGVLRLIASPDGEGASLRLRQDVRIYSAILDAGHHLVHEVGAGRGVWLHVVSGRVRLVDQSLGTGDGASLDGEAAVSLTAQAASEILLFDLN